MNETDSERQLTSTCTRTGSADGLLYPYDVRKLDCGWNAKYREVLGSPKVTATERMARAVKLRALYAEFDARAIEIAKKLVNEMFLLPEKRTIHPVNAGGKVYRDMFDAACAGQGKFIVDGILFKFARDWRHIYGGDSFAAKAAGDELRCLRSVIQLDEPRLSTPLMTLVDYGGFRIIAVSLLPIDSTTLVYGSSDGGITVCSTCDQFCEIIKGVGSALNLKPHDKDGIRLYTPCDLEGHVGYDGDNYLVDTARLFPPEAPIRDPLFIPCDPHLPARDVHMESMPEHRCTDDPCGWMPLLCKLFDYVSEDDEEDEDEEDDDEEEEESEEEEDEENEYSEEDDQEGGRERALSVSTSSSQRCYLNDDEEFANECIELPVLSPSSVSPPIDHPLGASSSGVTSGNVSRTLSMSCSPSEFEGTQSKGMVNRKPAELHYVLPHGATVHGKEANGGIIWWREPRKDKKKGVQRDEQPAERNERAQLIAGFPIHGDALFTRWNASSAMFLLLRPELVHSNGVPLSSDAWSVFQENDPARDTNNAEVVAATQRLVASLIPAFAASLNGRVETPVSHRDFADMMHRRGINVRFMGYLRALVQPQHLRSFLLTEMLSRTIKEEVRTTLRTLMQYPDHVRRRKIVDHFNTVFGARRESWGYWAYDVKVRLQHKFCYGLTAEEARPEYDLRKDILLFPLLKRVCAVTGVSFKIGAYNRLFDHPFLFDSPTPLSYADLEGFTHTTKNTSVLCEELSALITQAVVEDEQPTQRALEQTGNPQVLTAFQALLQLKIHRHIEAVLGADSKEAVASHYALAHRHLASGNTLLALEAAIKGFSYAEVLFGVFSEVTLQGAVDLGQVYQRMGALPRAVEYYRRALTIVKGLYIQHPLVGMLTANIFFCSCTLAQAPHKGAGDGSSGSDDDNGYDGGDDTLPLLRESFSAFSDMFGDRLALLLLPLQGFSQNDPVFCNKIMDTMQGEGDDDDAAPDRTFLDAVESFWPKHMLHVLQPGRQEKADTGTPVVMMAHEQVEQPPAASSSAASYTGLYPSVLYPTVSGMDDRQNKKTSTGTTGTGETPQL